MLQFYKAWGLAYYDICVFVSNVCVFKPHFVEYINYTNHIVSLINNVEKVQGANYFKFFKRRFFECVKIIEKYTNYPHDASLCGSSEEKTGTCGLMRYRTFTKALISLAVLNSLFTDPDFMVDSNDVNIIAAWMCNVNKWVRNTSLKTYTLTLKEPSQDFKHKPAAFYSVLYHALTDPASSSSSSSKPEVRRASKRQKR